MAMSTGGPGPIRRHAYPQNAEMNVTPFVDVMLVLLIIFMVAAPLATVDLPVDLPKASTNAAPPAADPIYVTIKRNGTLFLGDNPTDAIALAQAVDQAAKGDRERRLFIRCDRQANYGALMDVMNRLQNAGYVKFGLIAEDAAP
jgi:biopolymer transport protein ExbD/biopolymer transport protein TolR